MYERNYELLRSKFSEFFLPTLFTSMAGNICLFVDGLIVSFLLGAGNLSAIQIVAPVATFVNLIYWMIGLGGSVLCSVAKAEFDSDKSNGYFTVAIMSLLAIGILIAVFGLAFSGSIAKFLCASQSALIPDVNSYFVSLIIGMPFLCYMMSLSYFIRADGIPTLPFRAILLANIINICFDVIYIKFFALGIGGAALASSTGFLMGSIFISYYFIKSERTLKFIKLKVGKFFNYLKEIVTSGFSSSSTQLYLTLKLFIINILLGIYIGKSGLVAFGICYNSLFILYIFLIGTAQTMSPIVSVYFKEEDFSGVDYVIRRTVTRPAKNRRTSKSKAKQKVEYFKLINGDYEEIENCEGESGTQTNNIIRETVGNIEDFDLVISATAYTLGNLLRMGQTDKGKLFSRWLGLLSIEEKEKIAKDLWKKESQKLTKGNYILNL